MVSKTRLKVVLPSIICVCALTYAAYLYVTTRASVNESHETSLTLPRYTPEAKLLHNTHDQNEDPPASSSEHTPNDVKSQPTLAPEVPKELPENFSQTIELEREKQISSKKEKYSRGNFSEKE